MILANLQFAATSSQGISSLGINLKAFLFQLITFVIVLLILRRWVFPKLVETLEARRKTLEESLVQAKATQDALEAAETKAETIIHKAREAADQAMADARSQAKEVVASAESQAVAQAERITREAQEQLAQEAAKMRDELKEELSSLVVTTTEKVLRAKLSPKEDAKLVERYVKELKR